MITKERAKETKENTQIVNGNGKCFLFFIFDKRKGAYKLFIVLLLPSETAFTVKTVQLPSGFYNHDKNNNNMNEKIIRLLNSSIIVEYISHYTNIIVSD